MLGAQLLLGDVSEQHWPHHRRGRVVRRFAHLFDAGGKVALLRCQPAAKEPSLRERPGKFIALGEGIEFIRHDPACLYIVQ